MAKKSKSETANEFAVAICDRKNQLEVANCDLKSINIEALIRIIRGQQVMLDADLATLYGVENKRLKEQVNRNIERFPSDFMFKLSREELNSLRSQIATSNGRGGTRYLPYAFTRNGVAMLSSVLRSEIAVEMNIRIMRAFTATRPILESHAIIFERIFHLEQQQLENRQWMQATDSKIDTILDKMEEKQPALLPEQIFASGCVWDAWAYVSDLIRTATNSITLIDNFVDDRVLSLLSKRADGVSATIHTRYTEQMQTDLKKHNEQYPEIRYVQLPHRNHDRFLIIDDTVYLLGTSLKDMGVSLCAITKLEVSPKTILSLLK